jgi:hypothetical protein
MAAHDVDTIIIGPMVRMFGEYGTDDADLVIATYVRQFERFDAAVLAEAWDRTVADFMPSRRQAWPSVALIRKHAERVAEEVAAKAERHAPKNQQDSAWSPDAFAAADRLIRSPMGRAAAREGWITQLHDYCRRARSLPDASAIARLKREARLFDDAYGDVCRGNGGMLSGSLRKLGETFLRRRDELAAKVDSTSANRTIVDDA